jgi:hypothetical protein
MTDGLHGLPQKVDLKINYNNFIYVHVFTSKTAEIRKKKRITGKSSKGKKEKVEKKKKSGKIKLKVVSIPVSYSRGPGLNLGAETRISSLRTFVVLFSP